MHLLTGGEVVQFGESCSSFNLHLFRFFFKKILYFFVFIFILFLLTGGEVVQFGESCSSSFILQEIISSFFILAHFTLFLEFERFHISDFTLFFIFGDFLMFVDYILLLWDLNLRDFIFILYVWRYHIHLSSLDIMYSFFIFIPILTLSHFFIFGDIIFICHPWIFFIWIHLHSYSNFIPILLVWWHLHFHLSDSISPSLFVHLSVKNIINSIWYSKMNLRIYPMYCFRNQCKVLALELKGGLWFNMVLCNNNIQMFQ